MKSKSVHTGQTANINKTMALKGSKTYNAFICNKLCINTSCSMSHDWIILCTIRITKKLNS